MKQGGGKAKGSQFERDIARRLSWWWTNGETDEVFWRSPSSGVMKRPGAAGDISALYGGDELIDLIFIELKYYKEVEYTAWLTKGIKSQVLDWFAKASDERREVGQKYVWLIIKANRHNPVLVVSSRFWNDCSSVVGMGFHMLPCIHLYFGEGNNYIIVQLEAMLDLIDPESIKHWKALLYG